MCRVQHEKQDVFRYAQIKARTEQIRFMTCSTACRLEVLILMSRVRLHNLTLREPSKCTHRAVAIVCYIFERRAARVTAKC